VGFDSHKLFCSTPVWERVSFHHGGILWFRQESNLALLFSPSSKSVQPLQTTGPFASKGFLVQHLLLCSSVRRVVPAGIEPTQLISGRTLLKACYRYITEPLFSGFPANKNYVTTVLFLCQFDVFGGVGRNRTYISEELICLQ
jgi:hypothetical protein